MLFKKYTLFVTQVLVLSLMLVNTLFAEDVTIIGSVKYRLKQPSLNTTAEQQIQLLKLKPSEEEQKYLSRQAKDAMAHKGQFLQQDFNAQALALPDSVQLGMSEVPVLNQGQHGTCVTFALTGALDALIAKGDYISQLCGLQLGSYLAKHGYGASGWNGIWAKDLIAQIAKYGIINKFTEKSLGCGGLTEYPLDSPIDGDSFMEPSDFQANSEQVFGKIAKWSDIYYRFSSTKTLNQVKQALYAGDRLVFGVYLPRIDLGLVGAVGKYKTQTTNDSWVLTREIAKFASSADVGHELIITGYDDNAVAIDDSGAQHKGLLFLRNSWGSYYGNNGEFYMSYDYFKLLVIEANRFSLFTI